MRALIVALALMAATVQSAFADNLVDKLQSISVTINAKGAQGSGTLFTRKVGDETVSYVWTAAHVVSHLRKTRSAIVDGSEKQVVEFEDAYIVQEFRQNGRRVGEVKMDARVVRYSDAEQGEDLALLEVRRRNLVPETVTTEFYNEQEIPPLGTELYHVGSLLGQVGSNSLTTGIISQHGRTVDLGAHSVVFDQTSVTAFPGSSGGGVFRKSDGKYIGMLVRGAGEQFNLIVPMRRLRSWAKTAGIEWAIDPSLPIPSDEELKKLPIEDAGVGQWDRSKSNADKAPSPSVREERIFSEVL